jgi:hypothetical protein
MRVRRLAAACATCLAIGACGSVGPDWGFEQGVDWDVGEGSEHGDTSADAGSPILDPCGAPDAGPCDPLTGAGCDGAAGYACSFYTAADGTGSFACLSDSTEVEGAACDAADGPWCGPGLACSPGDGSPGVCAPFCCGDAQCASGTCAPSGYPDVAAPFGVCADAAADAGAGE